MTAGCFAAGVTRTDASLTVDQFYETAPATPGNVGVCLSGGGSRALTAGMGQLAALEKLQVNGQSVLSQVKAISCVSGGSWLAVPFTFLTGDTTDGCYLYEYVEPAALKGSALDDLPPGSIGSRVAHELEFSLPWLAAQAVALHVMGTPAEMLWQTLIGLHILEPYGLFAPAPPSEGLSPTTLFTFDDSTRQRDITNPELNPSLGSETAFFFADATDAGRIHRPFLICNTSLFVTDEGGQEALAPVQATAFFTGVVGAPAATDKNGARVGGGGVTSFAFNSDYEGATGSAATVAQTRQWSLTDITGCSSAAFAAALKTELDKLSGPGFFKLLREAEAAIIRWIEHHFDKESRAAATRLVDAARLDQDELASSQAMTDVEASLAELGLADLIPAYPSWSVADPRPGPENNQFADGGNLENTGINAMLSYADIDSILAFVNSPTRMKAVSGGVVNAECPDTSHTGVLIDGQIPPLFGYQPYADGEGYRLYDGADDPVDPLMRNSQVFPACDFPALLRGLWAASNGKSSPAIFSQELRVLDNAWFGVSSRDNTRTVTVVWSYLDRISDWKKQLPFWTRLYVEARELTSDFPNYHTLHTGLSKKEVNLLANLTAWSLVAGGPATAITDLFAPER